MGLVPKARVVVLGSGWAGFHVAKYANKALFDVRVVSPANHFLFTPLLPSTAVGTLEFRCIQEPIRTIKNLTAYYQAKARSVDLKSRTLICQDIFKGETFSLPYDVLVVATGCKTNTFNTPGIMSREGKQVFFLKHLYHARLIRNRILELFERAGMPQVTDAEKRRLLSFVVVGGGPTSVEFTGELYDFTNNDVVRWYPDLQPFVTVTLVEASDHILGSFDKGLVSYVTKFLVSRKISVRLGTVVKAVETENPLHGDADASKDEPVCAVLGDGTRLPFGMMVWSAGLQSVKFVDGLTSLAKGPTNRLLVDEFLRVKGSETDGRVFALGDCAVDSETPLAPLAKVAQQQGQYLARQVLNETFAKHLDAIKQPTTVSNTGSDLWNIAPAKPFQYFDLGSMAQIGSWRGVVDMTHVGRKNKEMKGPAVAGFAAFVTWRSAYLGMQVSLANKMLIPMHWLKTLLFGRDISRF